MLHLHGDLPHASWFDKPRRPCVSDFLFCAVVQENLVLVTEDGAARGDNQVQQSEQIQAYESPKLNIYRDMGDLLALDPPTPGLEATPWKNPDEESSH